jgi:hypothetical protein
MRTELISWNQFKSLSSEFALRSVQTQGQVIFRGQGDSRWRLRTTLDRLCDRENISLRSDFLDELLMEFRRQSRGLSDVEDSRDFREVDWLLLARHHGMPTSILDWTESPYVAAFFAMADEDRSVDGHVSVWALDRRGFAGRIPDVEFIEDEQIGFWGVRAREQLAVFMQINSEDVAIEDAIPDPNLVRFDLPVREANNALADLAQMRISARSLFCDLDGAARTSVQRVLMKGSHDGKSFS